MARCTEKKANKSQQIVALQISLHAARTEISRCHKRLEIDHYYRLKGRRMVRVEIPYEDRLKYPDGISCRDETIKILERALDRKKGK
jgi:hypothetical protein